MATLALTLLAGLLLALKLPPFDLGPLAWFAIAPVLVAAHRRRPLEAFGLGLLAGLLAGAIHVRPLPGAPGLQFALIPFLWLAMLVGLVTAAATWARGRWTGLPWALFVGTFGVAAEWLTTFSPLPLNLAFSQYRAVPILQVAALTGIWGVSFLLWVANAVLADWWLARPRRPRLLLVTGAALAGIAALGAWQAHAWERGARERLPVAAVQDHAGAETAQLGEPHSLAIEPADRLALTREAQAKGARLVVWSEGCLGVGFDPADPRDETTRLARELQTYLVAGYSEPGNPKGFNCAALVAPDGTVRGVHRKLHLFFGERQAVRPGRETRAVESEWGRLGMLICFDSLYTGVARDLVRDGARLIAMPNYDPPTRRAVLHHLHAAVLPFRAVEHRVPFVRADPNGCSQVVAATGAILAQAPLDTPQSVAATVALGTGRGTPFTHLGDWFAYLCLGSTLAFLLTPRRVPVKAKTTPDAKLC